MTGKVEVIGHRFDFVFGPNAIYQLHFVDAKHLDVTVVADPGYPKGTLNRFVIEMTEIRPNVYMVTWIEPATGNTVTHVEDFEQGVAYTNITDITSGQFWRYKGEIKPVE
jgi:hypothetical protein